MESGDISEQKTRKLFIDKLLARAKWLPIIGYQTGKIYEKASAEEYPTSSGPADYVLFNNKRPLAAGSGLAAGAAKGVCPSAHPPVLQVASETMHGR